MHSINPWGGGTHSHHSLPEAFLPGGHVHSWPPQGSGGSPSVAITSEVRQGSPGLQGGILEDGQLGEDTAGDAPQKPLGRCWTPVLQEGSDLRQRMGRGHRSRADVASSFFLEAPG